jgi:hypothetical protein
MSGGILVRHSVSEHEAPTEPLHTHGAGPVYARWLFPGLVIVVALIVSIAAVVVIADSSRRGPVTSVPTASGGAPPVGDRGADPEDLPSAAVGSTDPATACVQTVVAALEKDNLAGNRIEAVRISRTYGDSSPQNRAYSDVSTNYYNAAHTQGIAYATGQYQSDIERSCRDEPSFRVAQMRQDINVQYPEIDQWSDGQLLAFRRWVCPIRNTKGKPTASAIIQQRYDVSNSVAYLMMDSSAC